MLASRGIYEETKEGNTEGMDHDWGHMETVHFSDTLPSNCESMNQNSEEQYHHHYVVRTSYLTHCTASFPHI
jgi:hypothetical protein